MRILTASLSKFSASCAVSSGSLFQSVLLKSWRFYWHQTYREARHWFRLGLEDIKKPSKTAVEALTAAAGEAGIENPNLCSILLPLIEHLNLESPVTVGNVINALRSRRLFFDRTNIVRNVLGDLD